MVGFKKNDVINGYKSTMRSAIKKIYNRKKFWYEVDTNDTTNETR
jgi:hypothetical protein